MATGYTGAREHLDDILRLACLAFSRRRVETQRAVAQDLEIVELAEVIEARMNACAEPLPLDHVRNAFQLEPTEQRCLWLALAFAVSSEVRAASGYVAALPIEVFDRVVYGAPRVRDRFALELGTNGRLLRYGLLETMDDDQHGPRLGRIVRVADAIVDVAYGSDSLPDDVNGFASLGADVVADLLIPPELVDSLRHAVKQRIENGTGPIPIVRGADDTGKRSLATSIAAELGARALVVDCRAMPRTKRAMTALQREAILRRAVLVFAHVDAVPEPASFFDARLRHYPGPVVMTAAPSLSGGVTPTSGNVFVELVALTEAERAQLWTRYAALPSELAAQVAARYRLSGGQIRRAATIVRSRAAESTLADVHVGVRAAVEDKLSGLATRITWQQQWSDLVLPDDSLDELREMIGRVRHRKQVLDDWGFGRKIAKGLGLAVLFSGPPGTGKTMAAGLVARELGLDLYAVDLSRMVSKYIGETEKNLAQVFDAAEAGHAILLFDEADSLFSKRTEVKSSVDRYANLEVNYLLQRMEAFDGITILTTNFDAAIDEAFRRRLSFRIAFPLPEEDERARLWQALIPNEARGRGIDFDQLASKFAMSGGYIKNAALRAAFLAAADREQIEMKHLLRAAVSEYASMGKVMTQRGSNGF